jgi:RNA polymerase sigma-70 factor (ECF subfamily)
MILVSFRGQTSTIARIIKSQDLLSLGFVTAKGIFSTSTARRWENKLRRRDGSLFSESFGVKRRFPRHKNARHGVHKMDTPQKGTPSGRNASPPFDTASPALFWQHADAFRPYLKAVAGRVLGRQVQDKVSASDVVQQCLLEAFKKYGQFRGKTELEWRAWLVAIVRNEAVDVLNYWVARRERPLDGDSRLAPKLADDSSGPAAKASRMEQAARLTAALERLSPDHQEVLRLRNFESLAFAEVAARMGRSEPAARQLWIRALDKLREELGENP